jgi:hypothetical protein
MPDNIAVTDLLQNKVISPTALLEPQIDYDIDPTAYRFQFKTDPAGFTNQELGRTEVGALASYGTGALTRFYTVNPDETPFATAKPGQWLQLSHSLSGNDNVYVIATVIDAQNVLLQGTFTLPDVNDGNLCGVLLETDFISQNGFASRTLSVITGGVFDDETYRNTLPAKSWWASAPYGAGVRKGDILRVLDKSAVPVAPMDFTIAVVRHDALHLAAAVPVPKDATVTSYVILREPPNGHVTEELLYDIILGGFVKTGTPKPLVAPLANGSLTMGIYGPVLTVPGGSPETFLASDKGRYIDIAGCGTINWTATLGADGTLSYSAGAIPNPLACAAENGCL